MPTGRRLAQGKTVFVRAREEAVCAIIAAAAARGITLSVYTHCVGAAPRLRQAVSLLRRRGTMHPRRGTLHATGERLRLALKLLPSGLRDGAGPMSFFKAPIPRTTSTATSTSTTHHLVSSAQASRRGTSARSSASAAAGVAAAAAVPHSLALGTSRMESASWIGQRRKWHGSGD